MFRLTEMPRFVRAIVCLLYLCGCGGSPVRETASVISREFEPKSVEQELPGLHNVLLAADGIYSGSEPHGDEAFAGLAKLGIRTILSVDGARPDVELARQHGLRYVHVPIGYDGVSPSASEKLAAAARETEGPVYVHCHHGKHRGPSATAVICVAKGLCTGEQSLQLLKLAGTGQEYAGLWRDVAAYRPPRSGTKLPALVETAEVESLTAAMARVDRHWDNLKLCRDAGWQTPPAHRDLVPAREALLMKETFHEARRTLGPEYDSQFQSALEAAEQIATEIEAALNSDQRDTLGMRMESLDKSCKQCHVKYRN